MLYFAFMFLSWRQTGGQQTASLIQLQGVGAAAVPVGAAGAEAAVNCNEDGCPASVFIFCFLCQHHDMLWCAAAIVGRED